MRRAILSSREGEIFDLPLSLVGWCFHICIYRKRWGAGGSGLGAYTDPEMSSPGVQRDSSIFGVPSYIDALDTHARVLSFSLTHTYRVRDTRPPPVCALLQMGNIGNGWDLGARHRSYTQLLSSIFPRFYLWNINSRCNVYCVRASGHKGDMP